MAFLNQRRDNRVVGSERGGVRGLGFLVLTAVRRSEFRVWTEAVSSAVLIVHAADEHYVPLDLALAAAGAHPAWQTAILDLGGHYPHIARPEKWLTEIDPWLTRLSGRSGST